MATSTQTYVYQSQGVLQTNGNYVRITTLLSFSEMELYYKIFHDAQYGGFTTDPIKLYKQLKGHDMEIQALLNQKLITKDEYNIIFPESHETYSQEFTINIFYALAKHCVKKFPPLIITGESPRDSPVAFSNEMERLNAFNRDKKLQDNVNSSQKMFNEVWEDILSVLRKLSYDVSKVAELKTGNLEENKKYRFALMRAQVNLLTKQCNDLVKTAEVNSFALNKLMVNFNAAVSESDETIEQPESHDLNDLDSVKKRAVTTIDEVKTVQQDLIELKPLLKFWREKNIEGDIIILDDRLSKLRNDVNQEGAKVAEMFSTVSLDIVKIKERMSFHVDNSKFIVSPDSLRQRSDSRASVKDRANKMTDV